MLGSNDKRISNITPLGTRKSRRFLVRRARTLVLVSVVVLLLITNWSTATWLVERATNRLVAYGHIVVLYTESPDQRLSMPVKDVAKSAIANTWQAPRGTDRKHEGQDIFAPRGTPVLSATNGYVLRIGENYLGGQTVSIIGAGGRVYYYAHLDSYAPGLSEYQYVTRQTVLGFVGTTGNAQGTPPHLHFGVYASGSAINPLPLLVDRTQPERENRSQRSDRSLTTRSRLSIDAARRN
jgi:murein DD-endopeptidase MepM/ murein hydrolase activator NlpD